MAVLPADSRRRSGRPPPRRALPEPVRDPAGALRGVGHQRYSRLAGKDRRAAPLLRGRGGPEHTDERLICEPIWIDQLVVVMAADHPQASNTALTPESLLEHPTILPSIGTFTRKIINNLFVSDII